ncbi:MAG: hypothetical protein K2M97_02975, partial [Muribaculaceae bacterium]|nr:hypothetical protein [Muribaculaceae bacterium]
MDDIVVTDESTSDGDAGYYPDGSNFGFYISMPSHGYDNIWLYTKSQITDFNGAIAADKFANATIDGAAATVTASSLTLSDNGDGTFTTNGEITLSLGGAPVKIVFKGASFYY